MGKTCSIYTDNIYPFRVGHDFEMLWKQHGFLTCSGNKILNELYVQELLDAILILATLAIIKISGHSKLGSLEAKGNHLTDISVRNIVLKGTNSSQTSVIVQENDSPNNNLEKQARKKQQLASEKDKKRLEIQLLV